MALGGGNQGQAGYFPAEQAGNDHGTGRFCGDVEIVPVGGKGPGAIHSEHVVTFQTKEFRDLVRSSAQKLSLLPPNTAGLRLEIPDFLQNNFKVLQNAGYQIKKKSQGARRNVIFDDEDLDLALDVRVDDQGDWQRIRPAEARAAGARPGKGTSARRSLDAASISSMMGSAAP